MLKPLKKWLVEALFSVSTNYNHYNGAFFAEGAAIIFAMGYNRKLLVWGIALSAENGVLFSASCFFRATAAKNKPLQNAAACCFICKSFFSNLKAP